MTTPAGWYPDPSNAQHERWWDGARWTDHTQQPTAQPPAAPAVYMPSGDILPAAAPVPTPPLPAAPLWPAQPPAGIMPPQQPVLASRSYAAPLSFVGATRRLTGWARKFAGNTGATVAAWVTVCCVIPFAWLFVAAWYVVVFGLFGIFTFPYRLMRRSQRKSQHIAQAQLAATQAMWQQNRPG